MALRVGIIGMPNVGKSTLFNALTRSKGAQAANYPFCTIDPNVGIVEVPDGRLEKLAAIVHPAKIIPAAVEFVDIAGLVKGASKGEGLGNQFLAAIREVHALCHVVRFFEGGDVIHVEGSVDSKRDRETVETELALSDLVQVTKRIDKCRGAARTGDKAKIRELALLEKIEAALQSGRLASGLPWNKEDLELAQEFQLLTLKPIIYAANVSEEQLKTIPLKSAKEALGLPETAEVAMISAKVEEDLQELDPEEAKAFLEELGVTSSGLDRLIACAYHLLGYITFFTAGPKEVRAWTTHRGATAPEAAGVIHTDFQRGFIAAETIGYQDYVTFGGEQKAKAAGKLRIEGKNYVVQDGDVMVFRFNV
ncbi:TPA: redox-regulated ATPase YchF [Candidatus Peribacteria bacterium]|nr:MAG: redox-regulated ATPase YchF [Candidatus Peribacteria bacterium RIFOXYC2_FULL_58_10]OGJ83967.1 MAG: redox-regulated ATPase YchF [Candidatus Peribacteria bacterium RIFOXYD2_FULL_58_15]HAI98690.1 redox-regulated ATPase YchF [Candidatus Peribacteria bacterium]HAS34403.1 redox-regulated ATPase YchF [Candidatus Peribacteria bacterium]